jgi:Peptidase A4 family
VGTLAARLLVLEVEVVLCAFDANDSFTGSGLNSVTGQWTVTAVARSRKATYSSEWVGIDGYSNSSLIQTGTESDYYNGSAHYYAWWEILPAAETVIPSISVQPNDVMTASITRSTGSSWTITITDTTTNRSFTTTQTYAGPQTSAEWIEEAPTVGGRVATLANYGLATLDPGTVNNGVNLFLAASESGVMVQKGIQVSTPSNPDSDTDGFNAAYAGGLQHRCAVNVHYSGSRILVHGWGHGGGPLSTIP